MRYAIVICLCVLPGGYTAPDGQRNFNPAKEERSSNYDNTTNLKINLVNCCHKFLLARCRRMFPLPDAPGMFF